MTHRHAGHSCIIHGVLEDESLSCVFHSVAVCVAFCCSVCFILQLTAFRVSFKSLSCVAFVFKNTWYYWTFNQYERERLVFVLCVSFCVCVCVAVCVCVLQCVFHSAAYCVWSE